MRGPPALGTSIGLSVLVVTGAGCCAFLAPCYSGPAIEAFDGRRFHNQVSTVQTGFRDFLRFWLLGFGEGRALPVQRDHDQLEHPAV